MQTQYDLRFPVLISAAAALFFGSLALAYEAPAPHATAVYAPLQTPAAIVQTK